ncbi:MAG: bacillithiol system redox-active protein YtxJ [Candidatus Omnitrophota bacterium]
MKFFNQKNEPANDGRYAVLSSIDECLEKSRENPVIVFKHSSICPISYNAKREMDAFLEETDALVYLLVVQEQRPLSQEIAERLKVKHESPQAIFLRDRKVTAVFNHGQIQADNMKSASVKS